MRSEEDVKMSRKVHPCLFVRGRDLQNELIPVVVADSEMVLRYVQRERHNALWGPMRFATAPYLGKGEEEKW